MDFKILFDAKKKNKLIIFMAFGSSKNPSGRIKIKKPTIATHMIIDDFENKDLKTKTHYV